MMMVRVVGLKIIICGALVLVKWWLGCVTSLEGYWYVYGVVYNFLVVGGGGLDLDWY